MNGNSKIHLNEYLEMETAEPRRSPNRELFKEAAEEMTQMAKDGKLEVDSEFLPKINMMIKNQYLPSMRTKNYRKSFTVVEATVNGVTKIVVFASKSLAIQIMKYIKQEYKHINLKYTITQM